MGFALMAAQRHARVIGLFVRLLKRDGKPEYLPHLPRVWRMFERALNSFDGVAREERTSTLPTGDYKVDTGFLEARIGF